MDTNLSRFQFKSNDHKRFENKVELKADNKGCLRMITIEDNIWGREGYTITIYNLDENQPLGSNNIQMAPKQMRLSYKGEDIIKLVGFGFDKNGASFADYGATIYLDKGKAIGVCMHMFDRNIDIYYINSEGSN